MNNLDLIVLLEYSRVEHIGPPALRQTIVLYHLLVHVDLHLQLLQIEHQLDNHILTHLWTTLLQLKFMSLTVIVPSQTHLLQIELQNVLPRLVFT